MSKVEVEGKALIKPNLAWQEWAKARAQNAPSPKRMREISKKVKINVTQLVLDERRGE